jgi:hypothetical protein
MSFAFWQEAYCCHCATEPTCELLDTLNFAQLDDGMVTAEIAETLGFVVEGEYAYARPCKAAAALPKRGEEVGL